MAIELIIGGSIAIVFFIIQQNQGKKIQGIIDYNEKSKKDRKKIALSKLEFYCTHLWAETQYVKTLVAQFYNYEIPKDWENYEFGENELTENWLKMIKNQSKDIGENIRNWTLTSYDLLNSELLNALQSIHSLTSKQLLLDKVQPQWDIMDCDSLSDWLEHILVEEFNHSKDNIGMVSPNTGAKL